MKIIALLFVFGMGSASRLEKTYLPPVSRTGDGESFVQAPGLFKGLHNGGVRTGSYQDYTTAGRNGQAIAITRYENQNIGDDGSYSYKYETANGISAEETGTARGNGENVAGFYSYTGTDGLKYTVHYTADENGFHAEGAHLPTPPPIPEDIRRGVELSLAAEARGLNQESGYSHVYNKYQDVNVVGAGIASGGYNY